MCCSRKLLCCSRNLSKWRFLTPECGIEAVNCTKILFSVSNCILELIYLCQFLQGNQGKLIQIWKQEGGYKGQTWDKALFFVLRQKMVRYTSHITGEGLMRPHQSFLLCSLHPHHPEA